MPFVSSDSRCPADFPVLGAKGAQCRRAVPAVRKALEEMQNLEAVYDIVCRSGHYIAAPDAERLRLFGYESTCGPYSCCWFFGLHI